MRYWIFAMGCLASMAGCASRSVGAAAPLSPLQERATLAAALDGLAWRLPLPVPYCVTLERDGHRSEPDASWLAALGTRHALLPQRRCPHTYGSMVRLVDSLGRAVGPQRPAGYIDPYQLTVATPTRILPDRAAVRVQAWQGTQFWVIYCEVYLGTAPLASCGTVEEGVS